MKRTAFVLGIVVVGALVAAPADAQRGGGRGGGGGGRKGGNSDDGDASTAVMPQPVNAVNILVMHIRELALSDSQVKRIVAIKRGLDSTNTPLLRRLDSLQNVLSKRGVPTAVMGDSLDPRVRMQQTVLAVRANIIPGRAAAYGLLSHDQLDKAQALEDAADQKYDDQERAAMAKGSKRGGG